MNASSTGTLLDVAAQPAAHVGEHARTRSLVAQVSVGIAGLHVVDDSFLHPEPGTSASDHLVSGLVPLALVGVAIVGYRRARAGVQAAIALAIGVLAVVVGATSAGHETLTVGPSGDDFSGLLTIAAGLALIGVGVVTLWQDRRRHERLRRKAARWLLILVGAYFVAQWVIYPIAFGYGTTHIMRQTVPEPKLGVAHENVSFTTSDGLELKGWYVPSRNGAAVIAFPGRSGPRAHARMLARHGYGVLLFDRRGEGKSEGTPNLFGWGGERDIMAAVEYLRSRPDVQPERIGGIGFSVGGELMLEAAAESDGLAAVVSEGAGTRVFREEMQDTSGLNRVTLAPLSLVLNGAVAVFSDTKPPPPLTDLAPKINQPLFVIWAPNGGNKETMSERYYELARGSKQIWAMPRAKHVGGIYDQPEEYERRVVGFFDRFLLEGEDRP